MYAGAGACCRVSLGGVFHLSYAAKTGFGASFGTLGSLLAGVG
jgi:hypothetical protein